MSLQNITLHKSKMAAEKTNLQGTEPKHSHPRWCRHESFLRFLFIQSLTILNRDNWKFIICFVCKFVSSLNKGYCGSIALVEFLFSFVVVAQAV